MFNPEINDKNYEKEDKISNSNYQENHNEHSELNPADKYLIFDSLNMKQKSGLVSYLNQSGLETDGIEVLAYVLFKNTAPKGESGYELWNNIHQECKHKYGNNISFHGNIVYWNNSNKK
jgi:hypothetical protein